MCRQGGGLTNAREYCYNPLMIKKLFTNKVLLVLAFSGLAVLGFGAFVWAEGGVITVCVTDTGLLKLIDNQPGIKPANCVKTLSWNIQGEKGEKGDKGDTGPQGPAGEQLHLFDANGQDLGRLIDMEGDYSNETSYTTYWSDRDLILSFLENKDQQSVTFTIDHSGFYYSQPYCEGDAYVFEPNGYPQEVLRRYDNKFFRFTTDQRARVLIRSSITIGCTNYGTPEWSDVNRVEEIPPLPIESLAWPLRIVSTNQ